MAATNYRETARAAAAKYGIDPNIFERMIEQESSFNPYATSSTGAVGLTQLMPGTAKELGVDPNDPVQNIHGGAQYLAKMLKKFGTYPLALAAYNAGPGNVLKYGGIPPFGETQAHVDKIMGAPQMATPQTAQDDYVEQANRFKSLQETFSAGAQKLLHGIEQAPQLDIASMMPVMAAQNPLAVLASSLLANTAGAVTGNRAFAQNDFNQNQNLEATRQEQLQARGQAMLQDAMARRAHTLSIQHDRAMEMFQAARDAGNHAAANEQLAIADKSSRELQKMQQDNATQRLGMEHAYKTEEQDQAFKNAVELAQKGKSLTGVPQYDAALRYVDTQQAMYSTLMNQYNDAKKNKATKAKNVEQYMDEVPGFRQTMKVLNDSLIPVIAKPMEGESSQTFANRVAPFVQDEARMREIMKKEFPNESEDVTPKAAAKPAAKRTGPVSAGGRQLPVVSRADMMRATAVSPQPMGGAGGIGPNPFFDWYGAAGRGLQAPLDIWKYLFAAPDSGAAK